MEILTKRQLDRSRTTAAVTLGAAEVYVNGLIDDEKKGFDKYINSCQRQFETLSGDPETVLSETNKFIEEEANMPLSENFSEEQLQFFEDRHQLIKYHQRSLAIWARIRQTREDRSKKPEKQGN